MVLDQDTASGSSTLRSPLEVFIGDVAAASVADAETALEKQQSSRGLITIQPNEPDLYGYTDENRDAVASITQGHAALLDWGIRLGDHAADDGRLHVGA